MNPPTPPTTPRTTRSRTLALLLAGSVACAIAGSTALARAQPEPESSAKQPAGQPARKAALGQKAREQLREKVRGHLRERRSRFLLLAERAEQALAELDKDGEPGQVLKKLQGFPELRPKWLGRAGGEGEGGGGHGPAAERPFSLGIEAEPSRPLSPQEADEALSMLREHAPEIADQLGKLKQENPSFFRRAIDGLGSRLWAIREAKERDDDEMVRLRVGELRNVTEMMRTLRELKAARDAGDESKVKSLEEQLRRHIGDQFDARIAIQKRQVASLDSRTKAMHKDIIDLEARRDKIILDTTVGAVKPLPASPPSPPGEERRQGRGDPKPPGGG